MRLIGAKEAFAEENFYFSGWNHGHILNTFSHTSLKCSLGGSFSASWILRDSGCHSNERKTLKPLLVRNCWPNLKVIWHKHSLGDPLFIYRIKEFIVIRKKTWPPGTRHISLFVYTGNFKSYQKLHIEIENNLALIFFDWLFIKFWNLLQSVKTWLQQAGAYIPYIPIQETLWNV